MKKGISITAKLIAPCGMNCALCMGYQREKNKCPGCRMMTPANRISAVNCRIKNCARLKNSKFCFSCAIFPCARMKSLDKRYRTKYGMSMIENLNSINKSGIRNFVAKEKTKWKCGKCGVLICVHKKECIACGAGRKMVNAAP